MEERQVEQNILEQRGKSEEMEVNQFRKGFTQREKSKF